jgi:hypothetical protein
LPTKAAEVTGEAEEETLVENLIKETLPNCILKTVKVSRQLA